MVNMSLTCMSLRKCGLSDVHELLDEGKERGRFEIDHAGRGVL